MELAGLLVGIYLRPGATRQEQVLNPLVYLSVAPLVVIPQSQKNIMEQHGVLAVI